MSWAKSDWNARELQVKIKRGDKKRIMSVSSSNFIGMDCSIVIVDTASYLSKEELAKIYSINSDVFILLG
jgi:hypothetical protein